ncbi:MAG: metallophosphoesterase [Oscillospiraceae bacterium]|nr:metallophosphoesterase [Oscillospiraceae bacterium]
MKRKPLKLVILVAPLLLLTALVVWIIWGNTALELNTYTINSPELPAAFEGYRIAQVSDLHNAKMGKDNEKLLNTLRSAQPDMIVLTGDLIDSRNTDVETAVAFVREAVKIAPCYYITGNHEARIPEPYAQLKTAMEDAGVAVLENERVAVELDGEAITLIGVNDPSFQTDYLNGESAQVLDAALKDLVTDSDGFTVLLSHRPELFNTYVQKDVDLVFSGHAHGGQFRLPFVGGLAAPNQGLFPEYDAGLYTENNTNMLVSRGIGNSLFPFRFNNPPEVIVAELHRQ